MELDHRRAQPAGAVARLPLFLVLIIVVISASGAASGAAQEPAPTEPPRPSYPERPPRDPVVLERTTLPDGSVNTVISMTPTADAYIASGVPNQNYASSSLFVGYDPVTFEAERTLLHFNVMGAVPDGAVINDATLQLYLAFANPLNDAPMPTEVRRLTSNWGEISVTWNNQPTWAEDRASNSVGNRPGWYYWELSGLVADWVNCTYPNHGIMIVSGEAPQLHERSFFSDEETDPGDVRPQLIVDYTVDEEQGPSVVVDPLPSVTDDNIFSISWQAEDQCGADIQYYDVQFRYNGGPWVVWLPQTLATSASFKGIADGLYEFEARGVDDLDQIEPFQDEPESATIVDARAPFVRGKLWLPIFPG